MQPLLNFILLVAFTLSRAKSLLHARKVKKLDPAIFIFYNPSMDYAQVDGVT